jgi:aryl-alcohol dehydrogenase-like predicted oxidoreductase
METMQRLQEEGKARYIGVSNFRVDQMDTARKTAPFVSNQVNYNMFLRTIEQELVPHARKTGTGIMVHSTLAKGLLAGKYGRDHQFPPDDERSQFAQYQGNTMQQYLDAVDDLKGVAADKGIGMVELAVAWTLRLPEVSTALVGAKNPEQLEAPIRAGEVTLTEEEISRIERVLATHKLESLAPFRSQIV